MSVHEKIHYRSPVEIKQQIDSLKSLKQPVRVGAKVIRDSQVYGPLYKEAREAGK